MIKIVIKENQAVILEGIKLLINCIDEFELVAEYCNGNWFIRKIYSFDIDVFNIDMLEMDGITSTKQALKINSELKFIALSLYGDKKHYHEMIIAIARSFVLSN